MKVENKEHRLAGLVAPVLSRHLAVRPLESLRPYHVTSEIRQHGHSDSVMKETGRKKEGEKEQFETKTGRHKRFQ